MFSFKWNIRFHGGMWYKHKSVKVMRWGSKKSLTFKVTIEWEEMSSMFIVIVLYLTSPHCRNSGCYLPHPPCKPGHQVCPRPHCHDCWPCVLLLSTRCTQGRTARPDRMGLPGSIPQLPKQHSSCYFLTFLLKTCLQSPLCLWALSRLCHSSFL